MSLIDFYKNVVNSLKLVYTDDGYIMVETGGDSKLPITIGDKSLVLPTKENIDTMFSKQDDGTINIEKVLFNPLDENVIKGDSMCLKKTKAIAERVAGHSLAMSGELLLMLAAEPEFQNKTTTELNKFLGSINVAQNKGIKKLVDDKSIDTWRKLYKKTLNDSKGMVSIFLKKGGVLDGIKYNRVGSMKFSLYDELLNSDKDTPIHGIRLRPKDIIIFKIVLEFLTGISEDEAYIKKASSDGSSPAFITLMSLYLPLINKCNKVITHTKHIDVDIADSGKVPLKVKEKDLENLGIYKSELLTIPSELDMNRSKANNNNNMGAIVNSTPVPDNDIFIKQQPESTIPIVQNNQHREQVVDQNPAQIQNNTKPLDTFDKIDQAMFGGVGGVGGTTIMQPVMQQQPMGVNNMPLNMGAQGMYTQPNNMYSNPNNVYMQPNNMYVQPNAYAQPMGVNMF